MSEQTEKKILSPEQAVQAACILFELNTREQDLLEMAQRAGVPCGDDASRRALTREWYGFVHAAVVYGLMAQASNQVMAEYLRSTRTLLSQMAGYTPEQIESFIDDTFSKGGNVIIPSFAVGRTQELLYFMREMKKEGLVKSNPDFTVCVDSPLANEATKIFSGDLRGYLDEEALEVVKEGERLFTFPGLMMTESSEESKMLNLDKSSKVIISASGMCDAGRIRHHLKHNLWREECAIVFVGYQGEGTLGRHLLEGAKQVRLFGEEIAVNASIYNFQGLSSHADRDHLLQWIDQVKDPAPQQIFVVHGDAQVTEIFANTLREKGLPAHAPLYEEVFDLARNVMLAAGVEIAPKKTSFASTGRPSTAYHELELAAMDLLSIIRASKGGANKDLKKMAAQLRAVTEKWKDA